MSRWFRHYAGMMRDEKLVAVAIRSKQPVHLVVWIWGAILESAAEIDDGGRFELDAAEVAYFLRADEPDVVAVLDALSNAGRVASGAVVKWGDRQYQSDKSAERQARYRERRRSTHGGRDDEQALGDVTPPSHNGPVTPQETDTELEAETETKRSKPSVSPRGTRWQKGRKIPNEWKVWAKTHFPRVDAYRLSTEYRKFEDWWPAQPGKAGVKLEWDLTFFNWLRKAFPGEELDLDGSAAPDLVTLKADHPDVRALEVARGKPFAVGNSGMVTIRQSDIDKLRESVH